MLVLLLCVLLLLVIVVSRHSRSGNAKSSSVVAIRVRKNNTVPKKERGLKKETSEGYTHHFTAESIKLQQHNHTAGKK